jgi:hypothetical protein
LISYPSLCRHPGTPLLPPSPTHDKGEDEIMLDQHFSKMMMQYFFKKMLDFIILKKCCSKLLKMVIMLVQLFLKRDTLVQHFFEKCWAIIF